ncbi:hypothetical protein ACFQV4_30990 [Streptomyces thermocarboxydus]
MAAAARARTAVVPRPGRRRAGCAAHAAHGLLQGGADGRETAERLRAAGRELRFSRTASGVRPTGAGARERALAQAYYATRRFLDLLAALALLLRARTDLPSAMLLSGLAAACADEAAAARHPPGARPRAGRGDDHAVRGRTRRPRICVRIRIRCCGGSRRCWPRRCPP